MYFQSFLLSSLFHTRCFNRSFILSHEVRSSKYLASLIYFRFTSCVVLYQNKVNSNDNKCRKFSNTPKDFALSRSKYLPNIFFSYSWKTSASVTLEIPIAYSLRTKCQHCSHMMDVSCITCCTTRRCSDSLVRRVKESESERCFFLKVINSCYVHSILHHCYIRLGLGFPLAKPTHFLYLDIT